MSQSAINQIMQNNTNSQNIQPLTVTIKDIPYLSESEKHEHDKQTEKFADNIIKTIIRPNYTNKLEMLLKVKKIWEITQYITHILSSLSMSIATCLSFYTATDDIKKIINYVTGAMCLFSLIVKQINSFAQSEVTAKTEEINNLLNTIGIKLNDSDTSSQNNQLHTNVTPAKGYEEL